MNINHDSILHAIQTSFVDLLELVEQVAQTGSGEDKGLLSEEAQRTTLMMIAAVIMSDNQYKPAEQAFLRLLVDWQAKPGGESGYLQEYASKWEEASLQVPRYFHAAVRHDAAKGTAIARSMLREIQLIGNNVCITDGSVDQSESETVKRYIAFLEEFMLAWNTQMNSISQSSNG